MWSKFRHIWLFLLLLTPVISRADGCQSAAFSFSYDIPNCTGQFLFQGVTDCGVGGSNSDWIWDFGDGTPQVFNVMNPTHEYLYEGVYTVTLWMYPKCHGPGNPPCINTAQITVAFPNLSEVIPVVASFYNGWNTRCHDSCDGVLIVDYYGSGYSLYWPDFPGATDTVYNVCPGTYYVYSSPPVGCGYTQGIIEVVNPPPITTELVQDFIGCFGSDEGIATFTASGGTPGYTYVWEDGTQGQTNVDLPPGPYTIEVTDLNGCVYEGQGTVIELPELFLDPFVSTDYNSFDISCYLGSDGGADANPSGGTPPYNFQWDDPGSQVTQVAGSLSEGMYHVVMTDSEGCVIEDSIALFHPTPVEPTVEVVSDYNGVPISCYDASDGAIEVTESHGGTGSTVNDYTYQWFEIPDGCIDVSCWVSVPGETSPLHDGIPDGSYGVSVTDLNGCTVYREDILNEPPPLDLDLSITSDYNGSAISCFGLSDGEVTYVATGGTGAYISQWTNNGNPGTVNSGLPTGTYFLELIDANACYIMDSIFVPEPTQVVVDAWITSDYNGEDVSCFGATDGSLEGFAEGGTGTLSLSWSNGATGTLNNTSVGAGSYILHAEDLNACFAEIEVIVTEPPPMETEINILTNYNGYPISCFGYDDASAEVVTGGGTGAYTYIWTGTLAGGQTDSVATDIFSGDIAVSATDVNGCVAVDTVFVSQPPPLGGELQVISNYNGSQISCFNASDGSVQVFPEGGVPPYSLTWFPDDNVNGDVISGLPQGVAAVQIDDLNGCEYFTTIFVSHPPALNSVVTVASDYNGSETSCHDSSDGFAHVSVTGGTGGYSYQWPNGEITPTSGAFYPEGYVAVEITDVNGCAISDSVLITSPPPVTDQITILTDYNGFPVSCYQATDASVSAAASGGTPGYSYLWDELISDSLYEDIGEGWYYVQMWDANGCPHNDSVYISEPPELTSIPSVLSDYNGWNISCFGYSDGSATTVPSGGVAPYSYSWTSGENTIPSTGLSSGQQFVTVTDANGCDTTYSVFLTEPPPLELDYLIASDTCFREQGSILASPSGGVSPYAYLWSTEEEEAIIEGLLTGEYWVTVTDDNNCTISATMEVPNIPFPVAQFAASDTMICEANEPMMVSFTDQSLNDVVYWTWEFPDGTVSDSPNPLHVFPGPGEYPVHLTVENASHCSDETDMTITIEPGMTLYLPNAITCNYDNINDVFFPKGTEVRTIEFSIFDRWGTLLFKGNSMDDYWNGSVNGYVPVIESYNWKVTAEGGCDNEKVEKYGVVTIVR